jgi:hypothetical protein
MPAIASFAAGSARGYGIFRRVSFGGPAVVIPGDLNFRYVSLLLPGDGTNGAQNNTFLDSSPNNFTITRNGNVTQGTFSPFSQTGWSNYFNGSSHFTLSSNTAFDFGTGDFTVEGWFYLTSSAGGQTLYSLGSYATNGILYRTDYFQIGGFTYTPSLPINRWFHSAVVRSGTSLKVFVNGVSVASATNSTSVSSASGLFIGTSAHAPTTERLQQAYVSNFRLIKGTALYTSNFTPPTETLTAITNTSLLTCRSNRFVDISTNAFTITLSGTPSVQAFSPFSPTVEYGSSTVGGSGYFDGTGDYLDITSNAVLTPSGDFTIEFWAYPTTAAGTQEWYSKGYGIQIYISGGNWGVALSSTNNSTYFMNNAVTPVVTNQWTHLAVTRSGNNYYFFINGVQSGSTVVTSLAPNTGTDVLRLGDWSGSAAYPVTGYISSVRFINGTALYTGTFIPSTSPLTSVSDTQFMCNFTNAGITDATAKHVLETLGNAQVSTTQSKFGGSSMYFDGTGDYLKIPNNQMLKLIGGDWTIEFWMYCTGAQSASSNAIWTQDNSSGGYSGIIISVNSSRQIQFTSSTSGSTWNYLWQTIGTYTDNTWNHVAITKSGSTVRGFFNGSLGLTISSFPSTIFSTSDPSLVGLYSSSFFNGYIDDFRITKGVARYTANFTPPTSAFEKLGSIPLPSPSSIEVLVVSGGGGGYALGGGGGAGGMKANTSFSVSSETNYSVTVGAGGSGSAGAYYSSVAQGTRGGNSSFSTITTTGGGPGSGFPISDGNSAGGGSGGGGAYYGNAGLGISGEGNNGGAGSFNGGYGVGGGGGGRGAAGSAAVDTPVATGGNGGIGLANTITGASVTYAGGGGGSADGRITTVMGKGATGIGGNAAVGSGTTAGSGVTNLGGGGGGNYFGGDLTAGNAGNGGSGVVIIAYPSANANLSSIDAGLTYTYDETSRPGYKVYKFTAGTGNISW